MMQTFTSTKPVEVEVDGTTRIISVGSYLVFKSATRGGSRKAVRPVTGFKVDIEGSCHRVTVSKYAGWADFQVYPHEVIDVE